MACSQEMTAAEKKKAKKKARETAKKAGGDADDAAAPTGPAAKKGGKKACHVCTEALTSQHLTCIFPVCVRSLLNCIALGGTA